MQIKTMAIIKHPTNTRMAADRQTRYTQSKGHRGHAAWGVAGKKTECDITTSGFSSAAVEKVAQTHQQNQFTIRLYRREILSH